MLLPIIYSLISVFLVSLISLLGIFTILISSKKLQTFLIYIISFSAGALLGDVFIHLIPELTKKTNFNLAISLYILGGIAIFFTLEKIIHWQHCHRHILEENHIHPLVYTNLLGDALHNLMDGIIITATYLISIPAGIATTIAVTLHEIPQEIGDFGVLIHGGLSKTKALFLNFVSALTSFLGVALTIFLGKSIGNIEQILIPLAIGGFIYIAGSDLIPELHKDSDKLFRSFLQLLSFLAGIGIMILLLL